MLELGWVTPYTPTMLCTAPGKQSQPLCLLHTRSHPEHPQYFTSYGQRSGMCPHSGCKCSFCCLTTSMPYPGRLGREGFGRVPPAACSILLWWKHCLWIYFANKTKTTKQKQSYTTFSWVVLNHKGIKAYLFSLLPIAQACSSWQPSLLAVHSPPICFYQTDSPH